MGIAGGCDSDKPSIIEWGLITVMIAIIVVMISNPILNTN